MRVFLQPCGNFTWLTTLRKSLLTMKLGLIPEVTFNIAKIYQKTSIEQLAKAYPGESWLGLKKVHQLTSERDYSLHVNLTDFDGKSYSAVYDLFKVRTIKMLLFLCLAFRGGQRGLK